MAAHEAPMKLYDYWRSSAAYRMRIVMNLKGVAYEHVSVNLLTGAQREADYLARNPLGLVPALELGDGTLLTQSMAIAEFLEETHPMPPLLPSDPVARAQARAFCFDISGEMHPLYNLRVRKYLASELKQSEDAVNAWYIYWTTWGLNALEETARRLPKRGAFLFGDEPGLAEAFLVPQFYNANRFKIDLSSLTRLNHAYDAVKGLDAFKRAEPEVQPDAE